MPITLDQIKFDLDLTDKLKNVPSEKRSEAKQAAADELLQSIAEYLTTGTSPVMGGSYKRSLSKEYKKAKVAKGGAPFSDLFLEGNMLGSLLVRPSALGVKAEILKSKEKKKAYNHNVGDTLPQRQFIPNDDNGETWKKTILSRIDAVIEGFIDGSEN